MTLNTSDMGSRYSAATFNAVPFFFVAGDTAGERYALLEL
jgi:hypothetical protein